MSGVIIPDLDSMTKAEIVAFGETHGLTLDVRATKASLINDVLAALG